MTNKHDLEQLYPFLHGNVAACHILWDLVHTLLADERGSAAARGAAG